MLTSIQGPVALAQALLAQGMENEALRSKVAVPNMVNAQTTSVTPGGTPYQRRTVAFEDHLVGEAGIRMPVVRSVGRDPTPFIKVYDPSHPAADSSGIVLKPNVNPYMEAVDAQDAHVATLMMGRTVEVLSGMQQRIHNLMMARLS